MSWIIPPHNSDVGLVGLYFGIAGTLGKVIRDLGVASHAYDWRGGFVCVGQRMGSLVAKVGRGRCGSGLGWPDTTSRAG